MLTLTKAIITALEWEAKIIIKSYHLTQTKTLWYMKIFEWKKKNDDGEEENIVLIVCGEWKIQSSIATSYLCENYSPDKIVNIGIVGNLNHDILKIWDVIIPNTFVQHDFYMPKELDFSKYQREAIFLEYAIGEEYNLEKFSLHLNGICATGDQFIDNSDLASEIRESFWADIVDMEVYSILSVLKTYELLDKTLVIKAVSDGADTQSNDSTMSNLDYAMKNAFAILDFSL